jgi:hypothetical protein
MGVQTDIYPGTDTKSLISYFYTNSYLTLVNIWRNSFKMVSLVFPLWSIHVSMAGVSLHTGYCPPLPLI